MKNEIRNSARARRRRSTIASAIANALVAAGAAVAFATGHIPWQALLVTAVFGIAAVSELHSVLRA